MATELLAPERDFRGPGCDERCAVVQALVPGRFGRSELLFHAPEPHEAYGRWQGQHGVAGRRPTLETGPLAVDLESFDVAVAGNRVMLSDGELRLLLALARRPGVALAVGELIVVLWGSGYAAAGRGAAEHAFGSCLFRLRARLGAAGALITRPAVGHVRLDVLSTTEPLAQRRWARHWTSCRDCGSADRPHHGGGRCEPCYDRYPRTHSTSSGQAKETT